MNDEIKVNTNDLLSSSQTLGDAAKQIDETQKQLLNLNSVGNSYDGQLTKTLASITQGIQPTGSRLQNRSSELGDELRTRAQKFEAANDVSNNFIANLMNKVVSFIQKSPILASLFLFNKTNIEKATFLWGMSGLGFGSLISFITFMPDIRSLFNRNPNPVPASTNNAENSEIVQSKSYIGTEVMPHNPDPKKPLFPNFPHLVQNAQASFYSNCTWYAAAAVLVVHGIHLVPTGKQYRVGNGGEFGPHAEDGWTNPLSPFYGHLSRPPDQKPEAGDLWSYDSHVAFVEKVDGPINGKYTITVSEENWPTGERLHLPKKYGITEISNDKIDVPKYDDKEVKRWRRVILVDANNNGDATVPGIFIHFKDEKQ